LQICWNICIAWKRSLGHASIWLFSLMLAVLHEKELCMYRMKRGFNKAEAMDYLGVKAKFFDLHMMPQLKNKVIRAGISLVFQRNDLDEAWERYTLTVD